MTLKSDALLTTQSDEIANEVAPNANSAARVGQMLKDLVDSKSSKVPDFEFEGTVEDATPVTSLGGDSMTLTLTEDCVHQIGIRAWGVNQVSGNLSYVEFSFVMANLAGVVTQLDSDVPITTSLQASHLVDHVEAGVTTSVRVTSHATEDVLWTVQVYLGVTEL
jgi:hypothetical protein